MDQFTLDAQTVESLTSVITDPSSSGNLGFLAGVLLVLMVIIAAFALTTFVLGIVAVAKAAKAGRACGFGTPMAKASIPFGILGIVAPIVMWRLSDTMCATGLLIAGFVCSIIAISSASNRLRSKAAPVREVATEPAEAETAKEAPAVDAAESKLVVESPVETDTPAEPAVDDAVADDDDEPLDQQVTGELRVISADEPTVIPVDPTEPAIEEENPDSVDGAQAEDLEDETEAAVAEVDDDASVADGDVVETPVDDESDEDEEPVEPMHKMTAAERAAQVAERDARRAAAAAAAAKKQARALALAAEDPEYAEYLAEQGKLAGGLKKN